MRVLIVDDEPLARERVRTLLAKESGVEVIGECANGVEAVKDIKSEKPDLVFLDIQMPGMDGFDVLKKLKGEMPAVIFVTAYDEYAVKAFEVRALDYLLKPFKPSRLSQALDRARRRISSADEKDDIVHRVLDLLDERERSQAYLSRISVRTGDRVLFIKTNDIEWIEASGNYVVLHVGGTRHMLRETLGSMESKLPPKQFHRLNRSAIANLEFVQEVQPLFNGEHVVVLSTGDKINLTRGLRDLQEKLKFS